MNAIMKLKSACEKTLNEIAQLEDLKQLYDFKNTYHFFADRIADEKFQIAVVSGFNSGKSTFVNSLLGKDVLQHASTETTAVITRIVNVNADFLNFIIWVLLNCVMETVIHQFRWVRRLRKSYESYQYIR